MFTISCSRAHAVPKLFHNIGAKSVSRFLLSSSRAVSRVSGWANSLIHWYTYKIHTYARIQTLKYIQTFAHTLIIYHTFSCSDGCCCWGFIKGLGCALIVPGAAKVPTTIGTTTVKVAELWIKYRKSLRILVLISAHKRQCFFALLTTEPQVIVYK